MSFLIAYASWSGNTQEVAELITETLKNEGVEVDTHRIGIGVIPNIKEYDAFCIGSFTWEKGATPEEVKDFVADVGYKPELVYVFGTGDTQFGGDERDAKWLLDGCCTEFFHIGHCRFNCFHRSDF